MILQNISKAIREQNYYAVALEFVIVIAGVVIGFQINAWNEGRAEQARGRAYLALLETEIASQSAELGSMSQAASARMSNLRAVQEAMDQPETVRIAPVDLALNIYFSRWQSYASPTRTVYDGLESSGDIALIGDEGLVEAIRRHYREIGHWDGILGGESFILEEYTAATAGYLDIDQVLAVYAETPEATEAFGDFSGDEGVALAEQLASDADLVRWLPEVFDHHRAVRANTQRLRRQTEALLAELNPSEHAP